MRPLLRGPRPAKGEGPPSASELLSLLPTMRRAVQRAGIRDDDDLVEELADAALYEMWRVRHAFRGWPGKRAESLRAYAAVIAGRVARKHRRRALYEQRAVECLPFAIFDDGHEEQVAARLTLKKMLARLGPRLRVMAIALAFHESLSDAAEDLGIPVGTACTRVRKIRRKLRRMK
jgi:RNA polymerase sigma factor (sigma-70 family)